MVSADPRPDQDSETRSSDYASGFRIGLRSLTSCRGHPRLLSAGFAAGCDDELSFYAGVLRSAVQESEDDAGKLVGDGYGDQLEGLGFHQPVCPGTQRVSVPFAMVEHRMRADDEQLAQIAVAHLRDATQSLFARG